MTVVNDDALTGEIVTERVRQIIEHEQEADSLQVKADEQRWEAARKIVEELESGKSQRQLAGEIGKSPNHVGYMKRTWKLCELKFTADCPLFNEVYNSAEVRGDGSNSKHAEVIEEPVHPQEPTEPTVKEQGDEPEPSSSRSDDNRSEETTQDTQESFSEGEACGVRQDAWQFLAGDLAQFLKEELPPLQDPALKQKIEKRLSKIQKLIEKEGN